MNAELHRNLTELNAGMERVLQSPRKEGVVAMIVRRPAVDEREIVDEAELDPVLGLVGDNWKERGSPHTPDGLAHPGKQLS